MIRLPRMSATVRMPLSAGQEDGRRVLVDTGERQQRLSPGIAGQHLGIADPEVGAPGQDLLDGADPLAAGTDLDIQSGIGIEPLGLGHVIAHKLGLVQPAQLQDHPVRLFLGAFTGQEGRRIAGAKQQKPKQASSHSCDSCAEGPWGWPAGPHSIF